MANKHAKHDGIYTLFFSYIKEVDFEKMDKLRAAIEEETGMHISIQQMILGLVRKEYTRQIQQ